jgi:DNA-binding XRE family transcriptional regulator
MDLGRQLAEVLQRLRREAALTQTSMAKQLGISQPTLNRLEAAEQNVTLKTLTQLCRALHCTIGELFDGRVGFGGGHRRLRPPRTRPTKP